MIDELPDSPDPAVDPPTIFSQKAAASVLAQKRMVPQLNALVANLNALAAGGAYSIPYVFASAPGGVPFATYLTLGSANQGDSTSILISVVSGANQFVNNTLAEFGASSSAKKGTLRLQKQTDPSKWITFAVTGVGSPLPSGDGNGYRVLTVVPINASGVAPFGNTDPLMLFFDPVGDKGEPGAVLSMLVRDQKPSGTAAQTLTGGAWNTRTLNTVVQNSIPGAALSGNEITLPVGTYWLDANAPAAAGALHQARVVYAPDGTVHDIGSSESNGVGGSTTNKSVLRTVITVTGSSKAFRIEHFANQNISGGLAAGSGIAEVYTEVKIAKVGS